MNNTLCSSCVHSYPMQQVSPNTFTPMLDSEANCFACFARLSGNHTQSAVLVIDRVMHCTDYSCDANRKKDA